MVCEPGPRFTGEPQLPPPPVTALKAHARPVMLNPALLLLTRTCSVVMLLFGMRVLSGIGQTKLADVVAVFCR